MGSIEAPISSGLSKTPVMASSASRTAVENISLSTVTSRTAHPLSVAIISRPGRSRPTIIIQTNKAISEFSYLERLSISTSRTLEILPRELTSSSGKRHPERTKPGSSSLPRLDYEPMMSFVTFNPTYLSPHLPCGCTVPQIRNTKYEGTAETRREGH